MSDPIVSDLRVLTDYVDQGHQIVPNGLVLRVAADEIERLRTERARLIERTTMANARLREANQDYELLKAAADEEIATLRAALTSIRDGELSYAAIQTVALEALLPEREGSHHV